MQYPIKQRLKTEIILLYDNETKRFHNPNNYNEIVSCKELYSKYIIEKTNESINGTIVIKNLNYKVSNIILIDNLSLIINRLALLAP